MAKTKTLVIASGYFNPVHKGHIEYLTRSKELGDKLFVIVNNDVQRKMKGSKEFMNEDERKLVIENLKPVDWAVVAVDKNNRQVDKSIKMIYELYKDDFQNFIFFHLIFLFLLLIRYLFILNFNSLLLIFLFFAKIHINCFKLNFLNFF